MAEGSGLAAIAAMIPPIAPSMVFPGLTLNASLWRPIARPTKYAPVSAQDHQQQHQHQQLDAIAYRCALARRTETAGRHRARRSRPRRTARNRCRAGNSHREDVEHRDREARQPEWSALFAYRDTAVGRVRASDPRAAKSTEACRRSAARISMLPRVDASPRRLHRGPTRRARRSSAVKAQSGRRKIAARRVGSATAAVRSLVLSTQPVVAVRGNSAEPALARLIRGQRGQKFALAEIRP